MDKKNLLLVGFITIICFCSCKNAANKKVKFIESQNVEITFPATIVEHYGIQNFSTHHVEYITYVDTFDLSLNLRPLFDSLEDVIKISLKEANLIHKVQNGISYNIQSLDSIFILYENTNTISLISSEGLVINTWQFSQFINKHNDNESSYEYTLVSMVRNPLKFYNNTFFINAVRNDIILNNEENLRKYFETYPEIAININSYKINHIMLPWPNNYQNSKEFFRDYWPQTCTNKKGKIIYSFAKNHTLFVYDCSTKKIEKHKTESSYFDNFNTYPVDKIGNMSYLKKYMVQESTYKGVIYDDYNKLYYRIAWHPVHEYENEDGITVNELDDKKWSIIVINENFEQIDEIEFNQEIYNYYYIFPTSKGLMIQNKRKTTTETRTIGFTLFQLQH